MLVLDSMITKWKQVCEEPGWEVVRVAMDKGSRQVPAELRMMLRFLQSFRPSVVMEIGTHLGGTLWAMKQYTDPSGLMISLDLPRSYIDLAKREEDVGLEGPECKYIIADSHDPATPVKVEAALGGRAVDFLFIDGGHLYESVAADYRMYSPFVRSGGWIGFHDINYHPSSIIDVYPFWNELPGFKIEFSAYQETCGIGLLRKD